MITLRLVLISRIVFKNDNLDINGNFLNDLNVYLAITL